MNHLNPYISMPQPYSSFENQKLDKNQIQTQFRQTNYDRSKQFHTETNNIIQNSPIKNDHPKTVSNFYQSSYTKNSYYSKTNINETTKNRDPTHISSNYFHNNLSFQQKQYLNNQDIKYDYNASGDNLNYRNYLDERYALEENTFYRYEIEKSLNTTYNRNTLMKDPSRQSKMRFSYLQPSYFDKSNLQRKNQFKSQLESLNKYEYQPIRPDVQYKDERQKIEFEELQEFFDVLKEVVWAEIIIEQQRCDIGKQLDFSIPDLYREYFQPFLAKIKREEIRAGFHKLQINISDDDITLLVQRFCRNETKDYPIHLKEIEYEEFKQIFISKSTKYAYDHIQEEKAKSNTFISDKTLAKVSRYLRAVCEQEQQFESYRVQLKQKGVLLDRVFKSLTKYRDESLSCHDLMYFFLRNCMQVTFDQFKMFFDRLDPLNQTEASKEIFVHVFKPNLQYTN